MRTIFNLKAIIFLIIFANLVISQGLVTEWEKEQQVLVKHVINSWLLEKKTMDELSPEILKITQIGLNISNMKGTTNVYLTHDNRTFFPAGILEVWLVQKSRAKSNRGLDPAVLFEQQLFKFPATFKSAIISGG